MNKIIAPIGWSLYAGLFVHHYNERKTGTFLYKSNVHFNPKDGNTCFRIVSTQEFEINSSYERRRLIKEIKKVLDFNRYILILDYSKSKGSDTFTVIVEFHCVLKSLPTDEQLSKMKEICSTFEEQD